MSSTNSTLRLMDLILQRTFQLYAVWICPDDAAPFSRVNIMQSASGVEGSL
jgi:hypothetical protein